MARYALADHVYVCVNGEHLVMLDVREDRYWALEASHTAGLDQLVRGWPVRDPDCTTGRELSKPDIDEVIGVLHGRGVLAETSVGKDATPIDAIVPRTELLAQGGPLAPARAGGWFDFLIAVTTAKWALRVGSFESAIRRARRRKAERAGKLAPLDIEGARRLVETFGRYRLFVFTSTGECLFDSLALIEFLARFGIDADWVFGVQARPFAAHCWVQHGEIVFNDTVEHVCSYTPIMVV